MRILVHRQRIVWLDAERTDRKCAERKTGWPISLLVKGWLLLLLLEQHSVSMRRYSAHAYTHTKAHNGRSVDIHGQTLAKVFELKVSVVKKKRHAIFR